MSQPTQPSIGCPLCGTARCVCWHDEKQARQQWFLRGPERTPTRVEDFMWEQDRSNINATFLFLAQQRMYPDEAAAKQARSALV